uniref:Uncharacterized protein n=1 Tax=Lepeophtheirus salmonis TaxID=72036 RepID=A0A0K2TGF9_LEPSM
MRLKYCTDPEGTNLMIYPAHAHDEDNEKRILIENAEYRAAGLIILALYSSTCNGESIVNFLTINDLTFNKANSTAL